MLTFKRWHSATSTPAGRTLLPGTRWLALGLLLAAAALLLPGAARAQVDPGSAERLLRKSGLWAQLDGIAGQVRAGLLEAVAEAGHKSTAAEAQRLESAATAAYAADRLRSTALREVSQGLEPAHLPALFKWYDSPTGVLITRLEEQSARDTRDSEAVMADGRARLDAMAATRREHIDALVLASGGVDAALSMALNTLAGVRQGLAGVSPPGQGPSAEETRATLAEQLPRLRPAFEQLVRSASAVAYAGADDAQLAAYVAFLRSPAGRHLSDVMQRVLDAAFLDGATELGRRLAPATGPSA